MIECRRIRLWRNQQLVLDDINWQTREGQQWFVLGGNGSGKTSLIEILLGYLWPQEGRVTVMGQVYGQAYLPGLRERIGYLSSWIMNRVAGFQRVEDIVASGSEAAVGYYQNRTSQMNERIVKKLDLLEAGDLSGKVFQELSCGQQYRVLFARALINDPDILILDEPFALLDLRARFQMLSVLQRLVDGKHIRQVIFITHQLDEILPFFTHGMILKNGRIFFQGKRAGALASETLSGAFDIDPQILPQYR